MADFIYSAIASLDGYVEDAEGRFDWAEPDEAVFRFLNVLEQSVGTHLYGRRMYETMRYWESAPMDEGEPEYLRDWAHLWRSAEKVVFSQTLASVSTARTRIERGFNPHQVRHLKTTAGQDLTVGGAELAGRAIRNGLVDELQLFVVPVVAGGGKAWLPERVRLGLDLLESRPFSSGFVFLRYRPATAP